MIVAVSDLHLGADCSSQTLFEEFLNEIVDHKKVEHFVLVGDVIDMWRGGEPEDLLKKYAHILEKLRDLQNEKRKVYILAGNHDFHMIEMKHHIQKQYDLNVFDWLPLTCGDQKYYFIHGYQFEFAGKLEIYKKFANEMCKIGESGGATFDQIWELIKKGSSAEEKAWYLDHFERLLELPFDRFTKKDLEKIDETIEEWRGKNKNQIADRFIVYGHTHIPFVNEKRSEANTGCWVNDPKRPQLMKNTEQCMKNTYITIEEGKRVTLKEYFS